MTAALKRSGVPVLVGCWLLGYWAPWQAPGASNTWLMLASWAASHGLGDLARSSVVVTTIIVGVAVLGALLRLIWVVRPAAAQGIGQAGLFFTCAPLCVLLPGSGAALFLLSVTLIAFAGGWGKRPMAATNQMTPGPLWRKLASESFPVLSALCFATMSWQYNPQWLLRGLLVSSGVALLLHAVLPSPSATR